MRKMLAVLAAVASAWAGAGAAQDLPDPEANIVEEVVVTARLPGPAWWRVSDADTTVYIMGGPEGSLPPGLTWDKSVFERRLERAHTFITGASIVIGISGLPAILKLRSQLKSKEPLETMLPPDLRARFVIARERLGQPAKRYAGSGPLLAGQQLVGDSREKGRWRNIRGEIEKAAKRRRLKPWTSAELDGRPFLKSAMASLTPQVQYQCLEAALDDVEAGRQARLAGEGWARGDVRAALEYPRSFNRCLLLLGGGERMWRLATHNQARDVEVALKRPGHAVAVIGLRRLLADDGVLEQLRARGYTVRGPGEPG
ncbi:MAG TPA: TraB/GumN family protein [Caulobacteraceae bacterium]